MEQLMIVLNQIGIFLILIALGIVAVKTHILDESGLGALSRVIVRLALPAYIFINTAEGATREDLASSLVVIPLTLLLFALLFLLSVALSRIFKLSPLRAGVFRTAATFGNVGFMGIPLLVALYPDTALVYISLYTIIDQIFFWTYGASQLRSPEQRQKKGQRGLKSLKNLLSPALVAILAATVCVLLDWHLPSVCSTALLKLGSATMPMSLLYVGGMLALTDVRKVLRCWELYAEIALKMIALPLAFYAGVRMLTSVPQDVAGTLTFVAGLPAINMVAMLAKNNGCDGDYAVCAVMFTTVACLVTLPLVSLGIAIIG
jgi:predicted permease